MKIPPHNPKPVNGRLRCLVRDKWIQANPEEKVRQRVLNYLLNCLMKKSKYAKLYIEVEPRINYDKQEKSASNKDFGRADITVYKNPIIPDKKQKPWMIIECKKSRRNIIGSDIDQAKRYANAEGINKVWVTTGDKNIFLKKQRGSWRNDNPFELNDTEFNFRRIEFPKSNSTRDIRNYFKKDCPDERYKNYKFTDEDEAIFVSSIQKLIHKLRFEKWIDTDHKKRKGFRIIEDLGVRLEGFGNPGYGSTAHQNRYRTIVCKYAGMDEELIVSLGVYPEKNCPSLCIGVRPENSNTGHHSLELNYQRYVYAAKNCFVLWHPGHIGGGQLAPGKAKSTEVIKYMENHDIKAVRDLVKRDTGSNSWVELGSMPLFWSNTTDGLLRLVRNLFLYGVVRHVYREKYKKQD